MASDEDYKKVLSSYITGDKDLKNANLEGAYLKQKDLSFIDFTNANLEGANLEGVDLEHKSRDNYE
jgi:uncharacterized protein YjbI with pentapeptide repeats